MHLEYISIQIILRIQESYIFSIFSLGLLENCFLSIQPIKFWKKHKRSVASFQCILLEGLWGCFFLFLQYQWYLLWWLWFSTSSPTILQILSYFLRNVKRSVPTSLDDFFWYRISQCSPGFAQTRQKIILDSNTQTSMCLWLLAQRLRMCAITYIWLISDVLINISYVYCLQFSFNEEVFPSVVIHFFL